MSKILIVIPHDRFRDEEYQIVPKVLKTAGHEVMVGSSHHTEAQGHFGMVVKPDINVSFVEPRDFEAIIFIGGRGVEEYIQDSNIMNLARNVFYERGLLAAIGMAVEILAYAGVLTSKKVTCDTSTIDKVQGVGAYYTGKSVEQDGEIITCSGYESSEEFAKAIIKALQWRADRVKGIFNARTPRS